MAQFDKIETQAKVIDIISHKLKIDKNTVVLSATLQSLGADSLDMVEMVMKFEEQFGIEINDEDAEKLQNVQDVIDYVHGLRTK